MLLFKKNKYVLHLECLYVFWKNLKDFNLTKFRFGTKSMGSYVASVATNCYRLSLREMVEEQGPSVLLLVNNLVIDQATDKYQPTVRKSLAC